MARKKKTEEVKAIDPKDLQCGDRLEPEPLRALVKVIIGKKKLFGGKTKPTLKNFFLIGSTSFVITAEIPEGDYTEHTFSRNLCNKFRNIESIEKMRIIGVISAMIASMYKAVDESKMPDECKKDWRAKLGRLSDMNITALKVIYDMVGYLEVVAKILVQLSHDMVANDWLMYGKIFEHYNFPELINEIDGYTDMLSIDLTNDDFDFDNEAERKEYISNYIDEHLSDKIYRQHAYRYYISYWFNRLAKTNEILIY